ncbi:tetratricopeptide repeat protein, partial [Salinispira pacifica]
FLMHYPDHSAFVQANYLKGRLLFLQQDYQSAIQVFLKFIAQFSSSPFIANAFYWSGEALYNLGHFDEAKKLFLAVVDNFPASYRVEAARYHLSLIDQKRREEELLKLLQWSHEEALRSVDNYQTQIRTYKEAIAAYQKRIAGEGSDALSKEISRLSSQINDLQTTLTQREQTIQDLRKQIADLQAELGKSAAPASTQGAAQPSQSYRDELLNMRQQTQELKQYLEQQLKQQQGGSQ